MFARPRIIVTYETNIVIESFNSLIKTELHKEKKGLLRLFYLIITPKIIQKLHPQHKRIYKLYSLIIVFSRTFFRKSVAFPSYVSQLGKETTKQDINIGKSAFGAAHLNNLYTLQPSKIVMYATEYCADCLRAKAFFESNKIEYQKVSLEGNEKATEFVLHLNNGNRSVPTIVFPDGTILVEPSWEELREKTTKP